MMYLTKEELVKNIADMTERAEAVIGHTDLHSEKLDPNSVIIPFLGNIFDSALIVTALEDSANSQNDCHRKALELVMMSVGVKRETKNFITQINGFREKYSMPVEGRKFNAEDCLEFLNAYDCFMFGFMKNSPTVQAMRDSGELTVRTVCFRNIVGKLIGADTKPDNSASNGGSGVSDELLRENNRLLSEILNAVIENGRKFDKLQRDVEEISKKLDILDNNRS